MTPLRPEHADKTEPVTGTEFFVQRRLVGYAYPVHGNLHNPTPDYRWNLVLDNKVVDHDSRKSTLVAAARRAGAADAYRAS